MADEKTEKVVKLVRIQFTEAASVAADTDGRQPAEAFCKGDIVEVSMGSALHWISRRKAVFLEGTKQVAAPMLPPTAKVITRGIAPKTAKAKVT